MSSTTDESRDFSPSSSKHLCRRFSLAEIQSATKDFNNELIIGKGGFGKVYKGQMSGEEPGQILAIKRLDFDSNQGVDEFETEIVMLSKLRHCHLVSLIGYCDDNKEMILVYEYMPNGTLYDHLHKDDTPLSWVQRLKIAIGAARGLDYLHTGVGTQHGVIHRDVKSSNILLDGNWAAMISDFGLSKLGPTNQPISYVDASVKGTFGYMDPEYFYTRKLTRKTDVYAFGVVLFELLSGRLSVDERLEEEQCSLVRWAQKCVKQRKYDQIVDPNIRGAITPTCLKRFAQLADRCLLSVPKKRPTLTEVVASLQAILEIQEKSNVSSESPGIMSFTWKIHKFLASTTKEAPGQTGISSRANHENRDKNETGSPANLGNNTNRCDSSSKDGSHHGEMPNQSGKRLNRVLRLFTFDELSCATSGFAKETCLEEGIYGKVYKGWVDKTTYSPSTDANGLPVAIKSLNSYELSSDLKSTKLDMLILKSEFDHPNLIKLLGYCMEDKLLLLVYEFMLRGNLQDIMRSGALSQIPLVTKVNIAVQLARGLVFLNKTQHEHRISEYRLDRDKILLDEDYTVKLSGYDITKLVKGSYPSNEYADSPLTFGDYYPGCGPLILQSSFSGFIVIFVEILKEKRFNTRREFDKNESINMSSWLVIARLCYDKCNQLGIESKVLRILKTFKKHIPEIFVS